MQLPGIAKTIAQRLLPARVYGSLRAHAGRRRANRWLRDNGVFEVALTVADRFHYEVQSGPFRGMKYTRSAVVSRHATPTLIGQYERQIYPALLEAVEKAGLVVDVGHAEGYYAIGFARMGKRVVAFDADRHERRICRQMAEANGVGDRVELRSWCSAETLRALTQDEKAVVISDIDGGEVDLFTEDVIRSLGHCDLIVEVHGASSEENEKFVRRFRSSHDVEVLDHPAKPGGVELLAFLGESAERMAAEYRPYQQWIIARPRMHAPEVNEATSVSASVR